MKQHNKRANLRGVEKAKQEQKSKQQRHLVLGNKIKCRVTGQFLPGEVSGFPDDDNDINKWRVTLVPEDVLASSYAYSLIDKSFPIKGNPDVIMQTYGSAGLLGKTVILEFGPAGIRLSGEVDIDAAANFGTKDKIDAKDVAVAQSLDLGSALLFTGV